MSMYTQTTCTLVAMIAVFALASWKLRSPEISMVITAIAGALVGGFGFPVRLLGEGMFTYIDLALMFITASVFINFYSEIGAINTLVRLFVGRFYERKWVLLSLLGVLMLIPGALTGAGTVSILVVGGLVSTVLTFLGFSPARRAAFVFMMAILSAAAPPINLWAMLMAAGANMPYVGFDLVLLVPVLIVAAFTVFYLGRGTVACSKDEALASLPPIPEGMNWFRISAPLVALVALILATKYAAHHIPVIGLPLTFVMCTLLTIAVDPARRKLRRWFEVLTTTVEQVFPLVATLVSVGMLVNILAGTGVRGLIAITFVTLPILAIYITALFFCPTAQGSLSYGSAVILGTPLIFRFNAIGANVTVVAAALSLMFPLGDCLPPSRVVGRVTIDTVGYDGTYTSFLKAIAVPWLFLAAVALLMFVFPNRLAFLVQ
ncbi:MAG: citrate transporter [Firmicutes bacterium]|jgi:CitMHS family citrate-Mg2+:H+ or citrate-Ca2+:H+ symporter|nr:citrate transporter [Bacillota bacterium]